MALRGKPCDRCGRRPRHVILGQGTRNHHRGRRHGSSRGGGCLGPDPETGGPERRRAQRSVVRTGAATAGRCERAPNRPAGSVDPSGYHRRGTVGGWHVGGHRGRHTDRTASVGEASGTGSGRTSPSRWGCRPSLEAWIEARGRRWEGVTRILGPTAAKGEYDGADPDQVSSLATRWLVADAYQELGQLDSAAAYFELIESTRLPFQHLALRGLVYPFAERRLALLYHRLRRPEAVAQHWHAFVEAFVTPDPEVKGFLSAGWKVPSTDGR